ncbi:hypothetical protein [Leucobacter ruminantium]|uniref:Uncharacterized protein n=1 Tax=Leucobacter ruminantium TaxID=1289170 RepID=A0A939LTA5_9MICO|nr:hypothetical protein [Leucobacter ruminantium]MBO1803716.1 hypothetical protein [Leucobacter ruminantium]
MPASSIARPHPSPLPWARVRGVAAASAVVVFLGSAIMAPFSMTGALADGGAAGFERQAFTAGAASEQAVDVEVPAVDTAKAAAAVPGGAASGALYTLEEFMFSGVVNWGGYKFTYYSQQVLPGSGLDIPGRHVNEGGFVSDADGYLVLAGSAPKGTVYETPFGAPGKIYDRGTTGNHLDVYIR